MSADNNQNLLDDPLDIYFNQNDETYMYIRELPFLSGSSLSFWSMNGFHRVFGLYIERLRLEDPVGSGTYSKSLIACQTINQKSKSGEKDWHHYTNFWPNRGYIRTYYSEYLDRDLQTRQRRTKTTEQQFHWYQSITSMLLIGAAIGNPAHEPEIEKLVTKVKPPETMPTIYSKAFSLHKYVWLSASRQLGQHVLISNDGRLTTFMVNVSNYDSNKWAIDMFPSAKITAQYPTIRNEKDVTLSCGSPPIYVMNRQVFTMGLLYQRFGYDDNCVCYLEDHSYGNQPEILKNSYNRKTIRYYEKGVVTDDRVYTRFCEESKPLSVAGVYDLTEELYREYCYDDRGQQHQQPASPCFALYMCAGAKLIVMDSYQSEPEEERHNRILVEQGGVVVVEDKLEMSISLYRDGKYVTTDWQDFCNIYMNTKDWIKEKVKKYKNPVLFLGANESDYNTIAWRLKIDKRGDETRTGSYPVYIDCKRRCILDVPEGAYIVAIEEWEPGVVEIWQRHQYEQLHRAIVRHSQDNPYLYRRPEQFSLPNNPLLTKILKNQDYDNVNNIFRYRDIEIDILKSPEITQAYNDYYTERQDKSKQIDKVYPKEFNFYRFDRIRKRHHHRCPPPTPPAYPPVIVTDPENPDQYRLFYLPQILSFPGKMCDLRTVFKKYKYDPMYYKTMSDENIYPFGEQQSPYLAISDDWIEFDEYEWFPIRNPFDFKHLLKNREDYRLGVDGRYYQKNGNQVIGSVASLYYEFVYPNDKNKTVSIQPQIGQINGQPLIIEKSDVDVATLIANNEILKPAYI